MSSAFNLSTLAAMQEQRVEQVSVHFWRCQLTREQPRFEWHPDAPGQGEQLSNKHKTGNGNATNSNGDKNGEDEEIEEADGVTRHLLHVTGCVLAPKATGIHLVTVRTSRKQQQQKTGEKSEEKPEESNGVEKPAITGTPILCIDPANQRTLALGHEFVLETGAIDEAAAIAGSLQHAGAAPTTPSSCTFELAEGDGPLWLTGTHRVHRVVPIVGAGEEEDEEEVDEADDEEAEADDEEAEADADEEEEDIDEEMEEDEEEEEEEEEKPKKRRTAATSKATSKKPTASKQKKQQQQASQAQLRRKRAKPDS